MPINQSTCHRLFASTIVSCFVSLGHANDFPKQLDEFLHGYSSSCFFGYEYYSKKAPFIEGGTNIPNIIQLDAAGNGWVKIHTLPIEGEFNYKNWLPNGEFTYHISNTLLLSGDFDEGRPTNKWTWTLFSPVMKGNIIDHFAAGDSWTETFSNYTGYWFIPAFTNGATGNHGNHFYNEEGNVVNGLMEGTWATHYQYNDQHGLFDVPRLIGRYVHGKRQGTFKWYENYGSYSYPTLSLTYSNNELNGEVFYTSYSGTAQPAPIWSIRGEVEYAPNESAEALSQHDAMVNDFFVYPQRETLAPPWFIPSTQISMANLKMRGEWVYYDQSGRVIGENRVINGNGHFKLWRLNGTLQMAGEIINGRPNGAWKLYNLIGVPEKEILYKDGYATEAVTNFVPPNVLARNINATYLSSPNPPLTPRPAPSVAPAAHSGPSTVPPPQSNIVVSQCDVTPSNIHLGDSAILDVHINAPAPPKGLSVTINVSFDGAEDTLASRPNSIAIMQGESDCSFTLNTQRVANPSKSITFTAYIVNGSGKTAHLNVSP